MDSGIILLSTSTEGLEHSPAISNIQSDVILLRGGHLESPTIVLLVFLITLGVSLKAAHMKEDFYKVLFRKIS